MIDKTPGERVAEFKAGALTLINDIRASERERIAKTLDFCAEDAALTVAKAKASGEEEEAFIYTVAAHVYSDLAKQIREVKSEDVEFETPDEPVEKVATLVRTIEDNSEQTKELFRCYPPMPYVLDGVNHYCKYVIVSAVDRYVCETYIFRSDEDGNVVDWGELEGSFQGEKNVDQALANAGYLISR